MPQCVIQQGAGLGDIFFTQKVAAYYRVQGYEIIWPVSSAIMWLKDYIPDVTWVEYWGWRNSHPEFMHPGISTTRYGLNINLGDSHHSYGGKIMSSKIEMCGISWEDWKEYFRFKRNQSKENWLYSRVFGLKEGEEYVFKSCMYSTPPDVKRYDFDINTTKKIIELEMFEGYTLFDWCKIIQNASEIYVVDSAINYIMEVLPLKSTHTAVFCARNKNEIDYLFTKQNVIL